MDSNKTVGSAVQPTQAGSATPPHAYVRGASGGTWQAGGRYGSGGRGEAEEEGEEEEGVHVPSMRGVRRPGTTRSASRRVSAAAAVVVSSGPWGLSAKSPLTPLPTIALNLLTAHGWAHAPRRNAIGCRTLLLGLLLVGMVSWNWETLHPHLLSSCVLARRSLPRGGRQRPRSTTNPDLRMEGGEGRATHASSFCSWPCGPG